MCRPHAFLITDSAHCICFSSGWCEHQPPLPGHLLFGWQASPLGANRMAASGRNSSTGRWAVCGRPKAGLQPLGYTGCQVWGLKPPVSQSRVWGLGSQSEFFVKTALCQPVKERHLKGGEMGVRSTESQPDATSGQHQQLSYQSPWLLSMCAGSGRFYPQSLWASLCLNAG